MNPNPSESDLAAAMALMDQTLSGIFLDAREGAAWKTVLAAMASAQRDTDRVIELENTLIAIRAINVNEFGFVADEAIHRLVEEAKVPTRMHAAMSPTIQARAEAAAKEISNVWSLISVDRPCGCDECTADMAAIIARHFADLDPLRAAAERAEEWMSKELDQQTKIIEAFGPEESGEAHIKSMQAVLTALRAALTPDAAADGTKGKNL